MKFSLEFIKEFCTPEISPEEIADRLTLAGMEVGCLERAGNDWVFEIEVTANRYDWLSIIGISREVAAVCGCRVNAVMPPEEKEGSFSAPDIIVEDEQDCPLYTARYVKKVRVAGAPSWMRDRLSACGVNTVNNVVDITNYCMLKWGNPLHAFDADKVEGNIYIRRARSQENFLGLDGKEHSLSPENLVIADEKKVIALAGVMGAKNTEVDGKTKNVLLEAALFSSLTVRRSRRAAGIETDSSYRFERRVLPEYVDVASRAAQELIVSLAGGEKSGVCRKGTVPERERAPIQIDLDHFYACTGQEIPFSDIEKSLFHLGFEVEKKGERTIGVTAPVFRLDIEREVDVYEEITRIYGYDKITPSLPAVLRVPEKGIYEFNRELRGVLVSLGLREIVSFSITSDEVLKKVKQDGFLSLSNPLRSQENALRPTLLTGALDVVRYNFNQKATTLRFFELGHTYTAENKKCSEKPGLSLVFSGPSLTAGDLKGAVEECLAFLNCGHCQWKESTVPGFSSSLAVCSQGKTLGVLGKVARDICDDWDIKQDLFFFQADIETWYAVKKEKKYRPFSRYPFVSRDISLGLSGNTVFRQAEEVIRKKGAPYCTDIELIDIYEGKKISEGEKAITIRVFYQAEEKTLTSEEVDTLHTSIRDALLNLPGITLR